MKIAVVILQIAGVKLFEPAQFTLNVFWTTRLSGQSEPKPLGAAVSTRVKLSDATAVVLVCAILQVPEAPVAP